MLLSVIIPELSKGTEKMLTRELDGIQHEIIVKDWKAGLAEATGDFVCLLEKDSAVDKGNIYSNLAVFTGNPLFRKLAMVSSITDMPHLNPKLSWTYTEGGLAARVKPSSSSVHAVRIGFVPGSVIRRSSIKGSSIDIIDNMLEYSTRLSLDFWRRGLRVSLNPHSVYYIPEGIRYKNSNKITEDTSDLFKLWDREMIS